MYFDLLCSRFLWSSHEMGNPYERKRGGNQQLPPVAPPRVNEEIDSISTSITGFDRGNTNSYHWIVVTKYNLLQIQDEALKRRQAASQLR